MRDKAKHQDEAIDEGNGARDALGMGEGEGDKDAAENAEGASGNKSGNISGGEEMRQTVAHSEADEDDEGGERGCESVLVGCGDVVRKVWPVEVSFAAQQEGDEGGKRQPDEVEEGEPEVEGCF